MPKEWPHMPPVMKVNNICNIQVERERERCFRIFIQHFMGIDFRFDDGTNNGILRTIHNRCVLKRVFIEQIIEIFCVGIFKYN